MALYRYEGSMCQVSGAFWSYFFLEAPTMRTRKLHFPDEALPTVETFLKQTQEARVCRRAPAVREVIKGQRPTAAHGITRTRSIVGFFAQSPKKGYSEDHAIGMCVDMTQPD